MSPEEQNYRLLAIERRLDRLEQVDPAVLVERISQMERQFDRRLNALDEKVDDGFKTLDEETGALRRSIIAAALTLTVSALITAATIWLVVGK